MRFPKLPGTADQTIFVNGNAEIAKTSNRKRKTYVNVNFYVQ